jgi:predicted metal-dependent hydrolase
MKYWCDNSPVFTHYYNAASILFPAWERAFCEITEAYKEYVDDPELLERMDSFIREETSHSVAHTAHNTRQGLKKLQDIEYEKTRRLIKRPNSRLWLGAMVSIEHCASELSRGFLRIYKDRDSREFNLYKWHSLEEIGHKSLAMDVWNHMGYPKKQLNRIAAKNFIYVWKFCFGYVVDKLQEERLLWRPRTWVDLSRLVFRVVAGGWIPYVKLFKDDFHPGKIGGHDEAFKAV